MKRAILIDGQRLCKMLAPLLTSTDFRIGLTGGCLYKEDYRNDIDILIFSFKPNPEWAGLNNVLKACDVDVAREINYPSQLVPAEWNGFKVDFHILVSR